MPAPIKKTDTWHGQYDAIIDVRSPSEYADDHIPGAINLPVLSDAERVQVGTLYKQHSPFEARKIGAAIISRNIASHLDHQLNTYPPNWSPLLYCWRGGQRSGAMAQILSEIGWSVDVLEGGYKSYRRQVQAELIGITKQLHPVMLDGATGVGKTIILHALEANHVQHIDLEGLAAHRGSVLGAIPGLEQPSQRLFESRLYAALHQLDLNKPIVFEAESSKIGNIHIPDCLWKAMLPAPSIIITADITARVDYILQDYDHITTDPSALSKLVNGMIRRHGHDIMMLWASLIAEKNWAELVTHLMNTHYDPAYLASSKRRQRHKLGEIAMERIDADHATAAANQIADMITSQIVTLTAGLTVPPTSDLIVTPIVT